MKDKYKLPWHVRQFVKKELMDYKGNKRLIQKHSGDTRSLLLAQVRISQVDRVFDRLNKEDREVAEAIFIDQYTQAGAETALHISKSTYYGTMSKVIYMTAREMELI